MIRAILREALLVAAATLAISIVVFVAFDVTGTHDWWGTVEPAQRAGVPLSRALARDVPMLWNPRVRDARIRTLDDLEQLGTPATAAMARQRLLRRGTAALPTLLSRLRRSTPTVRDATLEVLAATAPTMTGGERPPAEPDAALDYWDRFFALRGLDFRYAYAHRIVQRLVDHESRNADEQLLRLGAYALPAIFEMLEKRIDTDSARRLADILAQITGMPLRIEPDAPVARAREVVDTWRAWWFVERLEYETLTESARWVGHVTETRYGSWLAHALIGRLGTSLVTRRPLVAELRERAPRSVFVGGLGGLLATALVVAFGGGSALRRRPIGTKLLDLVGALVPGLAAFLFGFGVLVQICAAPRPMGPHLRLVLAHWPTLLGAVLLFTPLASASLRRSGARVVLHAVRHEAESWAIESRHPHLGQVLRHGLRVGMASLFAPLSLAAMPLVLLALVVEPVVGVHGMAALAISSLHPLDAPWLLMASITLIPIWAGHRWSHNVLVWALGQPEHRPTPPPAYVAPRAREPIPAPPDVQDVAGSAVADETPQAPLIEALDARSSAPK